MRKLVIAALASVLVAAPVSAQTLVSGSGQTADGRVFTVNARIANDGTVSGHATLINRAFSGDSGHGPFQAHIDITCATRYDDNTIIIGGYARSNDSNLEDAVFFGVQDNGKQDSLSGAYFWDGDPSTDGTASQATCDATPLYPLNPVIRGNLKVR